MRPATELLGTLVAVALDRDKVATIGVDRNDLVYAIRRKDDPYGPSVSGPIPAEVLDAKSHALAIGGAHVWAANVCDRLDKLVATVEEMENTTEAGGE